MAIRATTALPMNHRRTNSRPYMQNLASHQSAMQPASMPLLAGNEPHAIARPRREVERRRGLRALTDTALGRICPCGWRVLANRLAQLPDFLADFLVLPKPVEPRILARGSGNSGARPPPPPPAGAILAPPAALPNKTS